MSTFNFKVGPMKVETALMLLGAIAGVWVLYMSWGLWQLHLDMQKEAAAYRKWCAGAGGEVISSVTPWMCVKPNSVIQRPKP